MWSKHDYILTVVIIYVRWLLSRGPLRFFKKGKVAFFTTWFSFDFENQCWEFKKGSWGLFYFCEPRFSKPGGKKKEGRIFIYFFLDEKVTRTTNQVGLGRSTGFWLLVAVLIFTMNLKTGDWLFLSFCLYKIKRLLGSLKDSDFWVCTAGPWD